MRLPRVRVTVRVMMAFVVFVGLLLGWAAYRQRLKWQTYRVLNQDLTVRSAEVNYLNAGLAREAAQVAVARYIEVNGGEDENPTLRALRAEARKARQREVEREAVWKLEKDTLSRLISELYHSW